LSELQDVEFTRSERWQTLNGISQVTCNCSVVCPCLVSKAAPLTSRPTEGVCDLPLVFPIERGRYGSTSLDGLNVPLAIHTPGPMADGNWSVAAYIDDRADDRQTDALGAIFTGAAGGPMAAFAPLIGKNLGVRKVRITYRIDGKKRSAEIPGILHMSVDPLPTAHPSGEIWANTGHPVSPDKLAFAVGAAGNTFNDHSMRSRCETCGPPLVFFTSGCAMSPSLCPLSMSVQPAFPCRNRRDKGWTRKALNKYLAPSAQLYRAGAQPPLSSARRYPSAAPCTPARCRRDRARSTTARSGSARRLPSKWLAYRPLGRKKLPRSHHHRERWKHRQPFAPCRPHRVFARAGDDPFRKATRMPVANQLHTAVH
jgi:hypothetical protein